MIRETKYIEMFHVKHCPIIYNNRQIEFGSFLLKWSFCIFCAERDKLNHSPRNRTVAQHVSWLSNKYSALFNCWLRRLGWLHSMFVFVFVFAEFPKLLTCCLQYVWVRPIALFYSLQKQQKTKNIIETISIKNFNFCIFQTIRPAVFILMCVWYFVCNLANVKQP